jgi:RND family efflux transporter MFP subunit
MTRRMAANVAAGVLLAALVGCKAGAGGDAVPGAQRAGGLEAAPMPAREVAVDRPSTGRLQAFVEVPGTLVPFEQASIAAEGAGVVARVNAEEGLRVAAGHVLVQVNPAKAELAVRQADASLAQARASYDKARSELARKQQLLEDRTIAQGAFEMFLAQNDGAAAGVAAAETALELARRRLQDLTVAAPFAGVVKEKRVSLGEYVREGQEVAVLMRVDPLKLHFELPEKHAGRVDAGLKVEASVAALPGEIVTATVRTIFPSVAVQSRTVRVEALVPNSGYRLKPGFYASVRVPLDSRPGSFVVPRAALVRREGMEHVFVLKGDRVDLAAIQVGVETGDQVEVISGLGADDLVVVSGAETLEPGDTVKVRG